VAFVRSADTYDLLSPPEARLPREREFLLHWAGAGVRVLELACGPGAHAHALAGAGVPGRRVLATDLSPAMVQKAAQTYKVHGLEYRMADMLAPPEGPFDRVFILGNSLNLLPDEARVGEALAALRRVMAPGASLLLQGLNPAAAGALLPKQVVKTARREGVEILVVKSLVPHQGRRALTLSSFQVDGGKRWESASETAILLDLGAARLGDLLGSAGFERLEWYGGMDRSPFVEPQSVDWVVVAQRP